MNSQLRADALALLIAQAELDKKASQLPVTDAPLRLDVMFRQRLHQHSHTLRKLRSGAPNTTLGLTDAFYRFYHQSYEMYAVQDWIAACAIHFAAIIPERPLHPFFREIVREALIEQFDLSVNENWTQHTRPILEGSFHARQFLDCLLVVTEETTCEIPQVMSANEATALSLWRFRPTMMTRDIWGAPFGKEVW